MDYQTATNLEGYLQKQSPNILGTFQRRYFTFRFKGQYLVWFKKKPSSVNDEPKGFIKIVDIISVYPLDYDDKYFQIEYPQRTFVLKAQTQQIRDRWLNSLEVMIKHHKQLLNNSQNKNDGKNNGWRWKKANNEEANIIRKENQKQLLNEGEDSIQQNARQVFFELFGIQMDEEFSKNVIFGFLNRKGHIRTQTKWYFLCSQYNLYDQKDEDPSDIFTFLQTLEQSINSLNSTNIKKKYESSDSDSEDEVDMNANRIDLKINQLYQFDINNKKMGQILPLVEVVDWQEVLSENPWILNVRYLIFNKGEQNDKLNFKQHQKELVLMSNYQTQITKWFKAIKVCFSKYSLAHQREKILDQRFVRYRMKMFRMNKNQQWRIIGSEEKPEYIYLNRQTIKVGGKTLELENIVDLPIRQKIKIKEEEEEKIQIGCTMMMGKDTFTVIFYASDEQKQFRKKLKIFLKKLQPYLKEKKEKKLKIEAEDLSMHYIDKKIRQKSNNIKINFYDVMEQQNYSKVKEQTQPKKAKVSTVSALDRFLSMFCGPTIDDIQNQHT